MARYRQLDLAERRRLYQMMITGRSVRQSAADLGRHVSTIYRELRRNRQLDDEPMFRGYYPVAANDKAAARRARRGKLICRPDLAVYVIDRLKSAWSPEQIAGHLRLAGHNGCAVSHETIYQYVYGADGRNLDLGRHLPTTRRKRRQRYARKPRGLRIPPANTIAARPREIGDRCSFGHWEGDLIAFRLRFGKANLTSLVERRSRYTVLTRNPSRHSEGIMSRIINNLEWLPANLRSTITFDRGTEFAAFERLQERLSMTAYFCQPSAPWQKGSVENSNCRIRRFLPLDTDITSVSDAQLQQLADRLNDTPRKCLSFRTPREVLVEQIYA